MKLVKSIQDDEPKNFNNTDTIVVDGDLSHKARKRLEKFERRLEDVMEQIEDWSEAESRESLVGRHLAAIHDCLEETRDEVSRTLVEDYSDSVDYQVIGEVFPEEFDEEAPGTGIENLTMEVPSSDAEPF